MTIDALTGKFARTASRPRYTASVAPSFADELDLWTQMAKTGAALPFQQRAWLDAWAATKGRHDDLDLVAVTIRDGAGHPVMGLPLVRERRRLVRIRFADAGLTDYNAPILTSRAPQDAAGARHLWRVLLASLPRCDQVHFERMPDRVGLLLNPLSLVGGTTPVASGGVALTMAGDYEDWVRAKPRRYRMELGRCERLFDATPGARFARVATDDHTVFQALERLQRNRIAALGHRYRLDEEDERRFYRTISADTKGGVGVLTALFVGEEVVAALYGLRDGPWFVMLRIGASGSYARFSPARHLIVQTMKLLRAEGVTTFDFGLGDYSYKRKLGALPVALHDLVAARSVLGLADTGRLALAAKMREIPRLHAAAKRVLKFAREARRG